MPALPHAANTAPQLQLSIPNRPPDFVSGGRARDCTAELWAPGPDETGIVRRQEINGDTLKFHSAFCDDVRGITQTLSRPTILTPFFRHMGVTIEHTPSDTMQTTILGLASPELVNARGQALPVPEDHRPPLFSRFEGTSFKAEDQRDASLGHRGFLVAMHEDYFAHDWMHMVGGLLLLSPSHIALVRQRFRNASRFRRTELTDVLTDIDVASQPYKLTSRAISALVLESQLPKDETQWTGAQRLYVDDEWVNTGEVLHKLLFGQRGDRDAWHELGQHMRKHCHVLGKAALALTTD